MGLGSSSFCPCPCKVITCAPSAKRITLASRCSGKLVQMCLPSGEKVWVLRAALAAAALPWDSTAYHKTLLSEMEMTCSACCCKPGSGLPAGSSGIAGENAHRTMQVSRTGQCNKLWMNAYKHLSLTHPYSVGQVLLWNLCSALKGISHRKILADSSLLHLRVKKRRAWLLGCHCGGAGMLAWEVQITLPVVASKTFVRGGSATDSGASALKSTHYHACTNSAIAFILSRYSISISTCQASGLEQCHFAESDHLE